MQSQRLGLDSFAEWMLNKMFDEQKYYILLQWLRKKTQIESTNDEIQICTIGKKEKKKGNTPLYFNTNYRTEKKTGTNHHGLLSISVWCFEIFLRGASTCGVGGV